MLNLGLLSGGEILRLFVMEHKSVFREVAVDLAVEVEVEVPVVLDQEQLLNYVIVQPIVLPDLTWSDNQNQKMELQHFK